MTQSAHAAATELSTRIWKTKGARLNAYRRLHIRAKLSLCLISLYSAYTLLAGIFSAQILALAPSTVPFFGIATTSLSLLILIISIIESTSGHELIANSLHDNARKLTKLTNQLEILKSQPDSAELLDTINKISNKYSKIIDTCPHNHSPVDYEAFKLQHAELKASAGSPKISFLQYHLSKIVFTLAALIPPIIISLAILLSDKNP